MILSPARRNQPLFKIEYTDLDGRLRDVLDEMDVAIVGLRFLRISSQIYFPVQ